MEDEEKLRKLTLKRETTKGQLKEFQSFLNSYDKDTDLYQLPIRLQGLNSLFEHFDALCAKIDLLNESLASKNERYSILNDFYKIVSIAQKHVAETYSGHADPLNLTTLPNSDASSDDTPRTNAPKHKIKVPQASIPTFTGQLEQWLSFKNFFMSVIHNQDDLSEVGKLHYLRTALRDEALKIIQVFSITKDNYTRAWDVLVKAYENKRLLISRHLSLLLHLPNQEKESYRSVERLADEAQQHVQSLASLNK
ncbi:uncharacterized protein LOC117182604 [Belonocnema kinseyi]|uniref:uncharacterized protein LOC117182604 n=1 Tax=Belonocnema kinseyi TaxID=2817044 RepID=UPI00143D3EDA|nr:uncharacterized protein LOC117182604 [Belonocnema kinseyi]